MGACAACEGALGVAYDGHMGMDNAHVDMVVEDALQRVEVSDGVNWKRLPQVTFLASQQLEYLQLYGEPKQVVES